MSQTYIRVIKVAFSIIEYQLRTKTQNPGVETSRAVPSMAGCSAFGGFFAGLYRLRFDAGYVSMGEVLGDDC